MTNHEWNQLYCVVLSGQWFGVSIIHAMFVIKLGQYEREATSEISAGEGNKGGDEDMPEVEIV
eukprot:CAMPEP_0197832540 /NCGR_PEP_ID=MMETSP1437-20131217/15263_1 /TAXON_ID=49252 ORGANISM="Eucampia antarctica, Strain CCMP1452" /NCGR_SAMPLE_ID=MMETSP1437 /ASSEMBLY_ACC=CAM_ASM_001096 /LENGTH=62 /DNA_ID=CAMNT_0043435971 /DNA_START=363 /DNA_END=551 /DNA_ORIENTATION=-